MSWHKPNNRIAVKPRFSLRAAAVVCCIGLAPNLAGCGFQPLYGTRSDGTSVADSLQAVNIALIPGRVGQRLRNELLFRTTGGGETANAQYNLEIAVRESVSNILVRLDGDAAGQIYKLSATFKLIKHGEKKPILEGVSHTQAPFQKGAKALVDASIYDEKDKTEASIFASIRARQDAENRAARTAADEIRTRIAAFLAARS